MWSVLTSMMKEACTSKRRDLRVRDDNPCATAQPPDRTDARVKTFVYPTEFLKLVACAEVPRDWRELYAVAKDDIYAVAIDDEAPAPAHAEHFESLAQQSHAAHLGMWIFLGSEALLFAGMFALYAALRWQHGRGFEVGIAHSEKTLGSINTGILLLSSYAVATAVLSLRDGKRRTSLALVLFTIACGAAFLALKLHEYSTHFHEGIYPGGVGRFFDEHPEPGIAAFFTLYFIVTGLHSLHVLIGMGVLAWLAWKIAQRQIAPPHDHPLALGAMYWHLVDIVWIFLWPLFYLTAGG